MIAKKLFEHPKYFRERIYNFQIIYILAILPWQLRGRDIALKFFDKIRKCPEYTTPFFMFYSKFSSLQSYIIPKHNKYFREDANGTSIPKHVKSTRLGKNVKQVFTWIVWLYKNNGNMSGLVQTKSVASLKVKSASDIYVCCQNISQWSVWHPTLWKT